MQTISEREHKTLCQLEDGTIVPYDAAHGTDEPVYNPQLFEFIGTGHIYSVDGVLQSFTQKEWFYRYRMVRRVAKV